MLRSPLAGESASSAALLIRPSASVTCWPTVPEAAPWEKLKLRMVNGCHSALAYLGALQGLATVDQAVADPALREQAVRRYAARATDPSRPELAGHANALASALQKVGAATKAAWASGDPGDALANAVPYMQAFGHLVLAWTWLDLLLVDAPAGPAAMGRQRAAQYFFHYELPRIDAWLGVVARREATCREMQDAWFES